MQPTIASSSLHSRARETSGIYVALLTGGGDKPYAIGLTNALVSQGVHVDFIGSDALDAPELHACPLVTFRNLRGDQREDVSFYQKIVRIVAYYARLLAYAAAAKPTILHILWNNKLEWFDRTVLMAYYRLLGKYVVLTAHNINAAKRDAKDNWHNRLTLRIQYHLCHHILVHTDRMKSDLVAQFAVPPQRITVIPFGLNNTSPITNLTREEAKNALDIPQDARALLFFGQIAPYKGLHYLVDAFSHLAGEDERLFLVVAGKVKRSHRAYWEGIRAEIAVMPATNRVIQHIEFIPDERVELYFKACDVAVLPYTAIFQSGVPFLAFSFGLPVIATDVGSLREDVIDGETGFTCTPRDTVALAAAIRRYFLSDLYRQLPRHRDFIRRLVAAKHSWEAIGDTIRATYSFLAWPVTPAVATEQGGAERQSPPRLSDSIT